MIELLCAWCKKKFQCKADEDPNCNESSECVCYECWKTRWSSTHKPTKRDYECYGNQVLVDAILG